MPLSQYLVNEDPHPQVITKRSEQQLVYQQEVAIRYLRPPTPPALGEIIIQQKDNSVTQPAPPLIIRQQPARPVTPQPLVIREAPPKLPATIGPKVITISGKNPYIYITQVSFDTKVQFLTKYKLRGKKYMEF